MAPSDGITEYQVSTFVATGRNGSIHSFQVDLLGPLGAELNFDTDDGDPTITRSFSSLIPSSVALRSLAWTGLNISETEFLYFAMDVPDLGADPCSFQLHYRLSIPEPSVGMIVGTLGFAALIRARGRQSWSNHA